MTSTGQPVSPGRRLGDYRIVYRIEDNRLVVLVLDVLDPTVEPRWLREEGHPPGEAAGAPWGLESHPAGYQLR